MAVPLVLLVVMVLPLLLVILPALLSLTIDTAPAVIEPSVMLPAVLFVLPAPVFSVILTVPVPALILSPLPMSMTAVPAKRWALITPSAAVSLAVRKRLALSVVILALIRMLRPACKVSPLLVGVVTVIGLLMVMSLLACKVSEVPLARVLTMYDGLSVIVLFWSNEKPRLGGVEAMDSGIVTVGPVPTAGVNVTVLFTLFSVKLSLRKLPVTLLLTDTTPNVPVASLMSVADPWPLFHAGSITTV